MYTYDIHIYIIYTKYSLYQLKSGTGFEVYKHGGLYIYIYHKACLIHCFFHFVPKILINPEENESICCMKTKQQPGVPIRHLLG